MHKKEKKMYTTMKKIINSKNEKYQSNLISKEEYSLWKGATLKKLDVFLACDRINLDQYEELVGLFVTDEKNISE